MEKPTAELSSFAKAEIIRKLYDAADKVVQEQRDAGASSDAARLAVDALNTVIAQACNSEGEDFAKTAETAIHRYTRQISKVQGDNAANATHDEEAG